MGEVIHTAKIRLVQKKRPLREAHIEIRGAAAIRHARRLREIYGVKTRRLCRQRLIM